MARKAARLEFVGVDGGEADAARGYGARPGAAGAAPAAGRAFLLKRQISRGEEWTAGTVFCCLVLLCLIVMPFGGRSWITMPGYITAFMTTSFILNTMVAGLLFFQGVVERDTRHALLAAAFLYMGCIAVPHLLAFQDALVPGIVLGNRYSSIWFWEFGHLGFGLFVLTYCLMPAVRTASLWVNALLFLSALPVLALATILATAEVGRLPHLVSNHQYAWSFISRCIMDLVLVADLAALVALVLKYRYRTTEHLWLGVGLAGACADVILTLRGGHRYSIGWYLGRACGLTTPLLLFTSLLHDILITCRTVVAANGELDRMTMTDPLTKLGNRRMFDQALEREWRRCRREALPLSVVMLDVDHFKTFNDTYGHQAGDACLQQVAQVLLEVASRGGDLATRYGGEEFALILPGTNAHGSLHVANAALQAVRGLGIAHEAAGRGEVTMSAGAATLPATGGLPAAELVRLADASLYRAKAAGRDTAMAADSVAAVDEKAVADMIRSVISGRPAPSIDLPARQQT